MSIKTRLDKLEKELIKDDYVHIIQYVDIDGNVVNEFCMFKIGQECISANRIRYNEWKEKYEVMDKDSDEFIEWLNIVKSEPSDFW